MIFSYSGKPGGGKTYEAFRIAVLAKLAEGRNVVTNIVGLDETKITGYIIDKMGVDPDKVGTLKIVSDDDVIADNFFYFKGAEDGETVVNRGDVVVIDEVWRVFKDVKKIGERRESFIAEHRHFTSDDGKPCELHVINQDVSEIPKFIKNRLEACYEMTKLSAVGANNRYRVDVFSSPKMYRKQLLGTSYGKYEKEIYDLYKSFDGNFTDFGKLDGRTNGFKSIKFLFLVGLLVFLVLFKGGDIYRFFTKGTSKVEEVEEVKAKEKSPEVEPIKNVKPFQTAEDFFNQGADVVQSDLTLSQTLYLCGKYVVNRRVYGIVCQYNGTMSYKTDKLVRSDDGLPYIILANEKVMDFLRIRAEEKDKQ